MIDSNHKSQIRSYLISKNLPTDILLEVQDHIENQIESVQIEKNISLQEAFIDVQVRWQNEFKMVKKSFFSFGKVPRIVREIQEETNRKFIKKSAIIAVLLLSFQLSSAKLLVREYYFITNALIYILTGFAIFGMLVVYLFSRIKKQRTRAERYFYNQLLNIFLFYIILSMFGTFTKLPTNSFKIVYDFVNGVNEFSVSYFMAATASLLFKSAITFYFFLMLNDRAKSIRNLKNYKVC